MRGDGRIYKHGTTWWVSLYVDGKEQRESTKILIKANDDEETRQKQKEKAEKVLLAKIKQKHAHQEDPNKPFITQCDRKRMVSELLDALEADHRLRGIDRPQFKSHLRHVRERFGGMHVLNVTGADVDRFIEDRLSTGAKPSTVNRSTQLLKQAFKLAIADSLLVRPPRVRRLSEKGNERKGFFSAREFRAVKENLPAYLQDFTLFGYLTGWRKGEIASLQWSDVEGDDLIRLRGENSKNGEGRKVVLEGELASLIERRRLARTVKTASGVMQASLVFHHNGSPIVCMRKAWSRACKLAGVDRLFHDLRRTAIRDMIRAGVGQKVAMEISGHRTRYVFDRYNISDETDLRLAMRRTEEYRTATLAASDQLPRSTAVQ